MDNQYTLELLQLAQNGDKVAENSLLIHIRDCEMRRRIAKYLHKNRQVEDEDLMQEFMIGVALNIQKADLTIGNPIEYIIQQGVYRVRAYLRKHIIQNTTQICSDCGYESRLNKVGNHYECKKCGSTHIETRETHDHDDIAIMNKVDDNDEYEDLVDNMTSKMIVEEFRQTLEKGTRLYSLFHMLYDKNINNSNPNVKNYMADIAKEWGTSQNLVVQSRDKLRLKFIRFCDDKGIQILNNKFDEVM